MRDAIEEVLLLQTDYSSKNTEGMKRRGYLVRTLLRDELQSLIPELAARSAIDDLRVQGKDGIGQKTEIPWTRIYSHSRAPSATSGWDLVFLFSAAGDRAYLSLNQGTTRWDGVQFVAQPELDLTARTTWARSVRDSSGRLPDNWTTKIQLDNQISKLGTGYELGNIVAAEYQLDNIPSDTQIEQDLLQGIEWLGLIYRAADEGLYVPGDSPDVADVEGTLITIASPRKAPSRGGPRLTTAERRVIEEHAVALTKQRFEADDMGYTVEDVGKSQSYDLHATKAGSVVKVEVKGTTSNGSEIILTRNEVDLHIGDYPANALAIVRNIKLHRHKSSAPTVSGGDLILEMPWPLNVGQLAPIAYRYVTGLPPVQFTTN